MSFLRARAYSRCYIRLELTAAEVRSILCRSAKDIEEIGYDTDSGWGILNLDEALTSATEGR